MVWYGMVGGLVVLVLYALSHNSYKDLSGRSGREVDSHIPTQEHAFKVPPKMANHSVEWILIYHLGLNRFSVPFSVCFACPGSGPQRFNIKY